MVSRSRERQVWFFLAIAVVAAISAVVVFLARGYRIDLAEREVKVSGMLVATSVPNGAQVWVSGELKTATDNTFLLRPGEYEVEIKKEGFLSWRKRLRVEKELVTKTETTLFPKVPSLSALTFDEAMSPVLSPDGTKIAYVVPQETDQAGLWVMPLSDLPLGFSRDPRLVAKGNFEGASVDWSPNSRQILAKTKTGYFLLDAAKLNEPEDFTNVTGKLEGLAREWGEERKQLAEGQMIHLLEQMQEILRNKADFISWSPDETKVLYTATASATIEKELIPALPAASTQKEERDIKPLNTYIYDIKEDRNFRVAEKPIYSIQSKSKSKNTKEEKGMEIEEKFFRKQGTIRWFPTSRHVVLVEDDRVVIADYDGTNYQTVYAGPFEKGWAVPYPNGTKLVVVANLSQEAESVANLYAISLR